MNNLLEEDEDDELSKEKVDAKDEKTSNIDSSHTFSRGNSTVYFRNPVRNETCI